jgi:hypothetical protein
MTEQFKTWALVELLGHTRMAGLVSEQNIAGGAMLRIDVPETENNIAFSRIVSVNAIYAINPITEESAKIIAANHSFKPIEAWDIRAYIKQTQLKMNEHTSPEYINNPDDHF